MFWDGAARSKFRFDAFALAPPAVPHVTNETAVGPVAVTFNATAPTPLPGTPPRPAIVKFVVDAGPTAPPPSNM